MSRRTIFVRAGLIVQVLVMLLVIAGSFQARSPAQAGTTKKPAPKILVMEGYPNRYQARLEQRNRTLQGLPSPHPGMAPHFLLSLTKRWNAGQKIKVAFKSGTPVLHKEVADTVNEWTKYANLTFDFGVDAQGNYRPWTTTDMVFAADIRVSFDQQGYYSLVGTDSINPLVTRPGEESLNLQGFDGQRPSDWKAVALHEFGHAIGFEHEHQSPLAPCDFRFDDDPGYMPTTDEFGQYVPDSKNRRPGLYTVLGGPPNNWPKAVVDFNLQKLPASSAYEVGPFDKDSIMKYFFPAWMFTLGTASKCYTDSENLVISAGDQVGAAKVYPMSQADKQVASKQRLDAVEAVTKTPGLAPAADAHYKMMMKAAETHYKKMMIIK